MKSSARKSLLDRLERLDSRINKEYFNLIIGKPCDSGFIAASEKKVAGTCRDIISSGCSESIRMYCIQRLALAETYGLYLQIIRIRNSLSAIDPNTRKRISWSGYCRDSIPEERKDTLLRQFISEAGRYSSIVVRRFRKIDEIFREYGSTVPAYFGKVHGYPISKVDDALGRWHRKAIASRRGNGRSPLGVGPLHDDYYAKRRSLLGRSCPGISSSHSGRVLDHFARMGMQASRLRFVKGSKGRGSGTPYCGLVRIPDKIYIYIPGRAKTLEDLYSLLHETWHAFFFQGIPVSSPFSRKYCYSIELIEFYPILFQNLIKDARFCEEVIGFSRADSIEAAQSASEVDLLTKEFYCINAMFNLRLWKGHVPDAGQLSRIYSEIYYGATGFHMPGNYWLLHHMMPLNLMHTASIFMALTKAGRMEARLAEGFGDCWWKERKAYAYLRKMMKKGADDRAKRLIASI